jgi:hypothetical protein
MRAAGKKLRQINIEFFSWNTFPVLLRWGVSKNNYRPCHFNDRSCKVKKHVIANIGSLVKFRTQTPEKQKKYNAS